MGPTPRVLFYKTAMAWPRSAGHDVATYGVMRAMAQLGVTVGFTSSHCPSQPEALGGIDLELVVGLDDDPVPEQLGTVHLSRLQERFRSYWGVPKQRIAALARVAQEFRADAVVLSGLEALPMVGGIEGPLRIWQASDEWFWHHLTQLRLLDRRTWGELRDGILKGVYERAYGPRFDRAWVVTRPDARAMRWVSGIANVDVMPNGIDTEYFQPLAVSGAAETAVFWGRLDFGPNIQALEWFCSRVWPEISRSRPGARFTIVGFNPTPRVQMLTRIRGVQLKPDVPDIRTEAALHSIVVLPLVSGAGIKNKLLEAAAMGKAIICTPRALLGLKGQPPLRVAGSPSEWIGALAETWDQHELRCRMSTMGRDWVVREHTWESAARVALAGIEASLSARKCRR